MNKEDYIKYWIETAQMDWSSSEDLYKTGHFVQSLFFAHLSLEKLCKAKWIRDNESNHPPRLHNLLYILKQTKTSLTDEQADFLLIFNDFQLEGRYPDYQMKIYKFCDKATTENYLKQANDFRQWLLTILPSKP